MKSWQQLYCVQWSHDSYCIVSNEVMTATVLCPIKSWQLLYCVLVLTATVVSSEVLIAVVPDPDLDPDTCLWWWIQIRIYGSPEVLTAILLCPLNSWQLCNCVTWSPDSCGIASPWIPESSSWWPVCKKYWNVRNANIGALSMLYSMPLVHQLLFLSTSFLLLPNMQYS